MLPSLYNSFQAFPVPEYPSSVKSSYVITYILLFFLVVFFIVIIVLLYTNASTKSKYVAPENCPVVKEQYAVLPSVLNTSLTPINLCSGNPDGYQGRQECTFSNINSILDAVNLCNKYENSICSAFAYNDSTNIVTFVNSSYTLNSTPATTGNTSDVYYKQNI